MSSWKKMLPSFWITGEFTCMLPSCPLMVIRNQYLVLTEFEVITVSGGSSFAPPIDWWPKHMMMSVMAACFCNRIMNIVFSCAQQWMATFSPILCFCRSLFIFIYSKFFSKTVSKFPPAETPTKTNFIISSVQVCMLLYVLTKQFSDFPTAVISENIWNICSCELNGFLTGFLVLFADILGISDDHSESVSSIFCTLC